MSKIQGEFLTLIKEGMENDPLGKQLVSLVIPRNFGLKMVFYTTKEDVYIF